MSSTDIEALMDDAMADPSLGHRFEAEPEAVLDEYDLSEEERRTLQEGSLNDVRDLLKEEETVEVTYRQAVVLP